jgi:hypothetical protein
MTTEKNAYPEPDPDPVLCKNVYQLFVTRNFCLKMTYYIRLTFKLKG